MQVSHIYKDKQSESIAIYAMDADLDVNKLTAGLTLNIYASKYWYTLSMDIGKFPGYGNVC